jgi:hypothetical protein
MAFGDDEFRRRLEKLFDYDRVIRSHAIYEATAIEGMVETLIAIHFCPNKQKHLSFVSLLFGRGEVPFSKKIDILQHLLQTDYPDILKTVPELINELNSLRRFRNKLAHHELVTEEDKLESTPSGIWLRSVNRNGKVVEEFISSTHADKILKNAVLLRCKILYVQSEVFERSSGGQTNEYKGVWESLGTIAKEVLELKKGGT